MSSFMQAAAEDLGIDLEIIYAERNHLVMVKEADEVLARKDLPDYLIVVNEKLAARKIIAKADEKGVKVFNLLLNFYGKQAEELGTPREKFKNWIGGLVPDNRWAGYHLAKALIKKAKEQGIAEKDVRLLPIAGDYATQATVLRDEGLAYARADYFNAEFFREIHCLWRRDMAFELVTKFINRDPDVNVVWAANDPMALGAIMGIEKSGLVPGKDVLVGGINWDEPALEAIKNGSLALSIGGHFMTGGWGLVMLYDYHHGYDFIEKDGPIIRKRIFSVIDDKNVDLFLRKFGSRDWGKIDFRRFSKACNNSVRDYDFSVRALLDS
ncbi:ABC transporter substrate-binding protein [Maridesulfovibrio sp.]|uniref:ABC transporter substrate-binding protein n=1 Tax=Maridesulfovibrio sp. TaxID=2795000 RepID=UPI002AA88554|nr:ABC transporter substrate-binding protein [Maridesulfovibrio sp.]